MSFSTVEFDKDVQALIKTSGFLSLPFVCFEFDVILNSRV